MSRRISTGVWKIDRASEDWKRLVTRGLQQRKLTEARRRNQDDGSTEDWLTAAQLIPVNNGWDEF